MSSVSHLRTLVELLQQHAQGSPSGIAYRFLPTEGAAEALTYARSDRQARAIAADLQKHGLAGERALLLFPPGLDYPATFLRLRVRECRLGRSSSATRAAWVSSSGLDRLGCAGRGGSHRRRACRLARVAPRPDRCGRYHPTTYRDAGLPHPYQARQSLPQDPARTRYHQTFKRVTAYLLANGVISDVPVAT